MKRSFGACLTCGRKKLSGADGCPRREHRACVPPEHATPPGTEQLLWPCDITPVSSITSVEFGERGAKYSWRMPWFLIVTSCVQLSVYFIANECLTQRLMLIPGHPDEIWRYFTYTLLHSDLMHLLLNVCLQCLIGFCLECEQHHWRVALIYVAGGVAGSLVTAYLQPELSLLGASACVYALLTSHVPHLALNFRQLPYRYLRIVSLLILCLTDVTLTMYHFLAKHNLNPRICVEAHIAGAVTGLCLGLLLFGLDKRHYGPHCLL